MPPKKKKTQLKPVARGFATTSVPKKVVEVPKEPDPPEAQNAPAAADGQPGAPAGGPAKAADASPVLSEEERVLQGFIDRFQDKVEKEIVRAVKVSGSSRAGLGRDAPEGSLTASLQTIEQERRFSDTLLRLDLDPGFVGRILELALEYEITESTSLFSTSMRASLTRPQPPSLWTNLKTRPLYVWP